jgi:hypothetical protein
MKLRDLRPGISFGTMAVGMLFIALALRASMMPAQNDTFWHLRAGADIWRTGAIPRFDHYSHTFPGAPWPDHEWLSQALMFLVYRVGGMPGLEIGATALVMGAAAVSWRFMVGPLSVRATVMTIGLMLSSWFWVLRPQVLSLFLLAVLLLLLVRERYRIIPALFVLWANAHGGVVLGGLVLGVAWAAAVLRWWRVHRAAVVDDAVDRRRVRALSIVVPLAGLGCAASPLGFGIYRFVIESTARSIAVGITEWTPVLPRDVFGVVFWIVMLAFLTLVFRRRNAFVAGDAPWGDWVVLFAALALLPFGVRSIRNVPPFVLCAIPAASRLLGPDFRFRWPAFAARVWRPKPRPPSPDHPRLNLALLAVMAAAAVGIDRLTYSSGLDRLGWHPIDDRALVAARGCDGPLYNHYDDGGFLIWYLPEKPVFVDGRQDPYPLDFLLEFLQVEAGHQPYRPLLDRFHVRCAFLPVKSPTVAALDRDGWISRYRDDKYAVLSAPPAASATPSAGTATSRP